MGYSDERNSADSMRDCEVIPSQSLPMRAIHYALFGSESLVTGHSYGTISDKP